MITNIIRYSDTNSVEVTWAVNDVVVKCHSYSQDQMGMLADDLGEELGEYQHIIDKVEANYIQPVPPDPAIIKAQRIAEIKNELAALDIKRIRPVAEGDTAYLATLNAQALALRTELQGLL